MELAIFYHTIDAFLVPLVGFQRKTFLRISINQSPEKCFHRNRPCLSISTLRMDDEMARKGIKVDMTVHSEEELDAWRRAGGRLSESWHDLSPITEVVKDASSCFELRLSFHTVLLF